jgi:hypothetical protein
MWHSPLIALGVVLITVGAAALDDNPPKCLPWSGVTSVTFLEGQSTNTRRRTSNIPTLNCYGNCPADARLLAAQCQQTGVSDDGTPSWKCYPKFAPSRRHYSFGTIRVECEGCMRKGDDQIIQKSCVLYYSIMQDSGVMRHGHDHLPGADNSLSIFLMVLLICFVALVARKIFCSPTPQVMYDHYGHPVATGYPVGGYPAYGGYGGGGGFGTGMLTGFLIGDALSHHHHGGSYGGGYDDAGYSGGGGGWGDGAGYGGSDAA